jgi:hypothetical protein
MPVRRSCDCENPPGGRVDCDENQMAVCIVENGVVRSRGCHTPVTIDDALALVNWALSVITGKQRHPAQEILPERLLGLARGRMEFDGDAGGVRIVTFSLPPTVTSAVAAVRQRLRDKERNRGGPASSGRNVEQGSAPDFKRPFDEGRGLSAGA